MVILKRLETIANFIGDKKLSYRENKIRKQESQIGVRLLNESNSFSSMPSLSNWSHLK